MDDTVPPRQPGDWRSLWDLDPAVRHLNHGSFGAVPRAVAAEQARLRALVDRNPVGWFAALPERVAQARTRMAALLGVDADRLAFVLNASAGCSVVYHSLLTRGQVDVLTTNHGYDAVVMGARRLAERTGGSFRQVAIPLDADAAEARRIVRAELHRRPPTLLVIDQLTSATARALPATELCQDARELGVLSLVDGAHAPGVVDPAVCAAADYWVGNLHKFGCAPHGSAVLVSREPEPDVHPLIDSWGTGLGFPERFDHHGTSDLTGWLTAPFAWEYLDREIGWPRLRAYSAELLDDATALLADALAPEVGDPVPEVGQPVGPMRLLRLPGRLGSTREEADGLRIPFLRETGVACAFTSFDGLGYLRLSAHAYNDLDDYRHLAAVGVPLLRQWADQR
ncbi:MAG: aminotransferase class V-fold PLP-dependent enzyme [Propionicimonas sp.]